MNTSHDLESYGWENCPDSISNLVNRIVDSYRTILHENLLGFYLHGSLAMGCFNPGQSDVDLLVVVRRSLIREEKKSIIDVLLEVNKAPSSVNPEMSIVLLENVVHPIYPTTFELHYSSGWRERYLADEVDWDTQRFDEDLVLHFLAIKRRGVCLYGSPIESVFPEIPGGMCVASLVNDLNWISTRLSSLPPTYPVLNPCRALAFLRTGIFMSKKEGGMWALSSVPGRFSSIISRALAIYQGDEETLPDQHQVLEFLEYTRAEMAGYKPS